MRQRACRDEQHGSDTNGDNRIDAKLPNGHAHADDDQDAADKDCCCYFPMARDGSQQEKITREWPGLLTVAPGAFE